MPAHNSIFFQETKAPGSVRPLLKLQPNSTHLRSSLVSASTRSISAATDNRASLKMSPSIHAAKAGKGAPPGDSAPALVSTPVDVLKLVGGRADFDELSTAQSYRSFGDLKVEWWFATK